VRYPGYGPTPARRRNAAALARSAGFHAGPPPMAAARVRPGRTTDFGD